MKKLLSIVLTLALLLSMVAAVPVAAIEGEESAVDTPTLGNYYKFTFEDGYDYVPAFSDTEDLSSAAEEYKGNTFYPLWTHRNSTNTIVDAEYKTITTSDEKEYNVLEIVSSYGGAQFTPVTKDGQPYELTPGKTYKIKINMFIPAAGSGSQNYVVLGNNDRFYNTDNRVNINGKVNPVQQAYRSSDLGIVKGDSFAYAYTAGTYDETTKLGYCVCGSASCSHQQRATDAFKVYREIDMEYTVPGTDTYTLNEETNSYSAEVDILTSKTDSTVVGTVNLNNYLTLYLSGGQANKVGSLGYYGTAPTAADASWNSSERINATYQIISIEVYEAGVGTANLHVNGEVTTVKGNVGEAVDTSALVVPEGYSFKGWYTDAEFENVAPTPLTYAEGAPVDLYAKIVEDLDYEETILGKYYKFTFENSEEGYDYTTAYANDTAPSGKAIKQYKGNTFYPLWTHRNSTNTIVDAEYKTITTSDEKEYNVLEIVSSSGGVQFTPVTKDGQPYELTPGKTYKIKINMFIPAAGSNSQNYVVLGNNDRFYNTDNKVNINGKVNTVQQAYRNQDGDLGIVKGSSFAYAYTAGTYDETTTLGKCACGSASCSHQQRATDGFKVYREVEREYTVPNIYTFDEDTNSYSAEVDILTSSSDSTVVGTATLNNYLTLYLSGGQANKVGSEGYYGTAPTAADASWNSAERINATYQIISIEVACYDGAVTFVAADGEETVVDCFIGDTIECPELTADRSADVVWSLSKDSYVAVPKTFEESITVYAINNDVIGFENYFKADSAKNSMNVTVTDEIAYEGEKALMYANLGYSYLASKPADWDTEWTKYFEIVPEQGFVALGGEEAPEWAENTYFRARANALEHSIALWKLENDKVYKVSYKYFVPAALTTDVKLEPYTNGTDLWAATKVAYEDATVRFTADTATGEWLDGAFYFKSDVAADADLLYIKVSAITAGTADVIFFDNFTLTEAEVVTFEIPEGATVESEGILKDDILTIYIDKDSTAAAPVVIGADGNPIEVWYDKSGNQATEFKAGAYTYKSYVFGDCDGNGKVDTTDLAALKLYLAGAGEVGAGGDCNGDGEITTTDLAALKLFLAGSGTLGPQA